MKTLGTYLPPLEDTRTPSQPKSKLTYRADRDELVGVIHHGDEQIEQDNHIDDGKRAKHE